MRIRAFFKNIGDIVATIKAATIKNKNRKKNMKMTFNKVDFILLSQLAYRTELFGCDFCQVWYVVSSIF